MLNLFKKPAFGLDISDYSIEALELEKKLGKIYLGAYGRVELEKGIVEDGKILNKEKLKEKIKKLIGNTVPRKLKINQVIVSLPESKTFFHISKLPANLVGKELYSAIESEALKTIPLAPEDLYFDFQIAKKEKDWQEVLYVGTLRETVNEYLGVLKDAGLSPLAFDIESASLTRAFGAEMIKDGGVLIADIGTTTTVLTIFDEELIRVSAIVPIAGNDFTRVISEKLKISLEKAEGLKRNCGLNPKKREGKIMLILQGFLQDILNEIKTFISFYEEKSGRKIKKILLCGGSSLIPELSSYLASNIGINTYIPNPWKGIEMEELYKHVKIKFHPIFFANVSGLAKRGLEKNPGSAGINLIPGEKGRRPIF